MDKHDGNMIRESEVGTRDSSVGSASVCVHSVKSVLSSGRDSELLVRT